MMIRRPPQPRTRVLGRLGFGGLGAVGISGLGVCCRHVEQAARLGDGVGESELGEAMTINAEGTVRLARNGLMMDTGTYFRFKSDRKNLILCRSIRRGLRDAQERPVQAASQPGLGGTQGQRKWRAF